MGKRASSHNLTKTKSKRKAQRRVVIINYKRKITQMARVSRKVRNAALDRRFRESEEGKAQKFRWRDNSKESA